MSRRFVVCVYVPIALLALRAAPANAQPASFQGSIAGFVFSGGRLGVPIDAVGLDASQVPVDFVPANVEEGL
jgi:hypothetical protein